MMTTTISKTAPRTKLRRVPIEPQVSRLLWALIALTVVLLMVRTDAFTSLSAWISIGVQFPEFGIMALGVLVAMVTGGIDLSIIGIANPSGIAAVITMRSLEAQGQSPAVTILTAIVVALAGGFATGILNGLLVTYVRIPAILVTLNTLELFSNVGITTTGGKALSDLPEAYDEVIGTRLGGIISMQLVIFIVVAVIVGLLLHRNSYGLKLFTVSANPTAARFSGLHSVKLLAVCYAISGLCGAAAGLVMLVDYNSAKPDYGLSYTLMTILIVVPGGVDPYGGRGNIWGVLLAIVILQILASRLSTSPNISNFYRPFIFGAVSLFVIQTSEKSLFRFKKRGMSK